MLFRERGLAAKFDVPYILATLQLYAHLPHILHGVRHSIAGVCWI